MNQKNAYTKTMTSLDLSAFIEKTMAVTLPDGNIINVMRPTKEIVLNIQQFQNEENKDEALRMLVNKAFSRNMEKQEIDVADWPENMVNMAFAGYIAFLNELMNNPNS